VIAGTLDLATAQPRRPTGRRQQTVYAAPVVRALLLGLVVVLAGPAAAAPLARQRVVLSDRDPELRHAIEQVLAPWHLEVVIEGPPPVDTAMAEQRADADTARFVVWRDGDQLVVYDRELGFTERRPSRSGTLDPPTAAAAALTVKTMMRLPPPPVEPVAPVAIPRDSGGPGEPRGIEVRLQAGVATRIAPGTDSDISTRVGGAASLRPWRSAGWRIGIAGDAGSSTAVNRASFKGTWNDWALLGVLSWTYARGAWELEPHAGAGIRRSTLDGAEMGTPRTETATLSTARGGVWVRRRFSRITVGVAFDADRSFGTPSYSKNIGAAEIFQVPGMAIELGAALAVDL
jgi:hypothetical protein